MTDESTEYDCTLIVTRVINSTTGAVSVEKAIKAKLIVPDGDDFDLTMECRGHSHHEFPASIRVFLS